MPIEQNLKPNSRPESINPKLNIILHLILVMKHLRKRYIKLYWWHNRRQTQLYAKELQPKRTKYTG